MATTSTASATTTGTIDVNGLVTSLMTVERQPVNKLTTKQTSFQTQLSAMGTIKSAFSTFQTAVSALATASNLKTTSVTSGDTTVFSASATAGTTAATGTHTIQVSQLAQTNSLAATGQSSMTTPIGTGASSTLSFDLGSVGGGIFTSGGAGIKTVTIDSTNNSLQGIRDAINAAGVGVTASIVNDGTASPYRLALVSNTTGAAGNIKLSVAGDATVSGLLAYDPVGAQSMTQTLVGQNSTVAVDGISVSRASNTLTDVIAGVTMNLQKVSATPSTLTVAQDTASATTSVQSFVDAYNTLNKALTSALDSGTVGSTAPLHNDATLRTLQNKMRNMLNVPIANTGSTVSTLSQIGVNVQKDGTLLLNATKLTSTLSSSPNSLAELFSATGSSTDSLVKFSMGSTSTQPGSYALNVTQIASQGKVTGSAAAGTTITAGVDDTIDLTVNGVAASITLSAGTYTAASLAAEVQSKINGASALSTAGIAVGVSETGGVLNIATSTYGSTTSVAITGGNGASNLLGATPSSTAGVDVAGTINGQAATGSGQSMVSTAGNSTGLSITVSGGALGARGTVSYSQGYAYQFNQLSTSVLASTGVLTARSDGITSSITSLGKQIDSLNVRMTTIEARYRAQYSALDAMLSKMTATSSFLTQQLNALNNN
ncbi:MAG: flagellar filament capping protein FliD [Nitrosomonadales bacterium]|nr:flagellar filament capping protein FliD [Nitrosomonadales bacterium]